MIITRIGIGLGALAMPLMLMSAVAAQDTNTLGRHLEHQQWQRLQDHQNQSRGMPPRERQSKDKAQDTSPQKCSAEALPAPERRRIETEYVKRVRRDGNASADAWVREQGKQFRLRLVAEGVCSAPSDEAPIAQGGEKEPNEDGCQMVMRPVAGLGGAPMTMAMVPECD